MTIEKYYNSLFKSQLIFKFVIFLATKNGMTIPPSLFSAVVGYWIRIGNPACEFRDLGWIKIRIRDKHP